MATIEPIRLYTLQEVVDLRLIPGIKGYAKLYEMVHDRVDDDSNKVGFRHVLAKETTKRTIRPENTKAPWNNIASKITIQGGEILKFLQINGLL